METNYSTIYTRIINKHATEADWKESSYKPLNAELIIYDIDDNYTYQRFKLGDGKSTVNELPFIIHNPLWSGTYEDYLTAYENGEIHVGMIVVLTDYDEDEVHVEDTEQISPTTSMLGYATLGTMILG